MAFLYPYKYLTVAIRKGFSEIVSVYVFFSISNLKHIIFISFPEKEKENHFQPERQTVSPIQKFNHRIMQFFSVFGNDLLSKPIKFERFVALYVMVYRIAILLNSLTALYAGHKSIWTYNQIRKNSLERQLISNRFRTYLGISPIKFQKSV